MEYLRKFETVTMHLPLATNEELLHNFIYGLKSEIRTHVLMAQPATLQDAQTLALSCEELRTSVRLPGPKQVITPQR
jgi:hypothetical protein